MSGARRRAHRAFYAATRRSGRTVLLLGPFDEKGVAVSALEPARELLYLALPDQGPVPAEVEVQEVLVPSGGRAPAGELNGVALRLHGH